MTQPQTQHTATPWYIPQTSNTGCMILDKTKGNKITIPYRSEDAAYIVKAVNSHEDLISMLNECLDCIDTIAQRDEQLTLKVNLLAQCDRIKQAIAKAGGG